ncbi:hypothetical protein GGU11DRAFT_845778 [Lentinula aff. detonsa]|nr:hypothetical protein GGU11DRAFT_845778 [Lentinula aff. detonsa]
MPLRGLFSKRNKSRTDVGDFTPASPTATVATESTVNSPTSEYIKADSFLPTSPNGRNTLHPDAAFTSPTKSTKSSVYPSVAGSSPASSSRLRLPFGRKRAAKLSSSNVGRDENSNVTSPPHPPFTGRLSTSAVSESDASSFRQKLGPPPSRSAIFSAYGDPHGASSTRSLPNEYSAPVQSNETLVDNQALAPKRPLFPWSKSQPNSTKAKAKSKSSPLRADDISAALEDTSSFNLKSFRHLGDPNPSPELPPPPVRSYSTVPDSANSSSTSLVPPGPLPGSRSRNASFSSLNDPSASQQRISVAAFREAQARRSLAGSPVPGPRSPSPGPILAVHNRAPPSNQANDVRQRRTSLVALGSMRYSSDEDDSSENEEDNSDTDRKTRERPEKKNTVKAKAKSEVGHGTSSYRNVPSAFPSPNSSLRPDAAAKIAAPRSRSDVYAQGRSQPVVPASTSTSVVSSNSGATTQNTNIRSEAKPTISARPPSKAISQSESDSDDSDNAPLATLVPPKRPSSSASNRSNPQSDGVSIRSMGRAGGGGGGGLRARVYSNAMPKPLIDINELTGPSKRSLETGTGRQNSQDGFTGGATLLSAGTTQGTSSMMALSSPAPSSVTSTSPPGRRFVSPPPSPISSYPPKVRSETTSPRSPSQAPSGLVQRRIPMGRKDPDVSSTVSSTTAGSDSSSSGRRKDPLSERLSKVVAQTVNSSPTITQSSLNPLLVPSRRGTAQTPGNNVDSNSSGDFEIPFTSSPSPTLDVPAKDHKSSADVVVNSYFPEVRAPSPKISVLPKPVDNTIKRDPQTRKSQDSTEAMADLADLLGAGIKLVSVNGEDQSNEDLPLERDAEKEEKDDVDSFVHLAFSEPPPSPNRITPIVVKTRPAAPSFAVTSRPQHARGASINILTTSTSGTVMNTATGDVTTATTTTTTTTRQTPARGPPFAGVTRPRSSTLLPVSSSKTSLSTWSSTNPSISNTTTKPPISNTLNVHSFNVSNSVASSSASSSSSSNNSGQSTNRNASSGNDTRQNRDTTRHRPVVSKPPARSLSANQMPTPMSRFPVPSKPFASQSPASSTGDSSSGRGAPITPRDGSDIGNGMSHTVSKEEQWGSGVSGLGFGTKHGRKRSIAFDDEAGNEGSGKNKSKETPEGEEARRRERRRSEARAAIELGNTINGPGPILDDSEDAGLPIQTAGPRMNGMSPMMMNGPVPGMPGMLSPQMTGNPMWGWSPMSPMPQIAPGPMLSPAQFMVPPPTDPAFFAAHQQAMMYAKQAYQMAVAQQAMAAAAEEWERGSAVGGFSSSQSMYGMPPSTAPSMMGSPYGMGGVNGWSTGSTIFPPSGSRSTMYGSGAMSEYGGGGRGGGWNSSRSVYGESFGPSSPAPRGPGAANIGRLSSYTRESGHYPPMPPMPPQGNNKNMASRQSANPRARTVSQPANPVKNRNAGSPARKVPPSSWKTNAA